MWIEKRSIITGRINVRFISGVTPELLKRHASGELAQDVFPWLDDSGVRAGQK